MKHVMDMEEFVLNPQIESALATHYLIRNGLNTAFQTERTMSKGKREAVQIHHW